MLVQQPGLTWTFFGYCKLMCYLVRYAALSGGRARVRPERESWHGGRAVI